ncbi:hypothetical protein [uncultured Sphingomonas sp.]|uniref:hypothetical protein n=1 Tax=uncultured Sphingomonas sp. TaxID=158754 RepID=UPI0035CA81FB
MTDNGTTAITDIHLALIVILAIAAIVAIVWGMRMKRARVAAAKRFETNHDESRDATVREQAELGTDPLHADAPSQSQSQVQSVPVAPQPAPMPIPAAPSPPPLADEPIAAAPMAARVASETAFESISSAAANPADRPVTALKGLGPKVATALADRGITTVGQLAALDTVQAETLDADLGAFRGRMMRDRWIEQARFLAAGDVKGFEAVFGRL